MPIATFLAAILLCANLSAASIAERAVAHVYSSEIDTKSIRDLAVEIEKTGDTERDSIVRELATVLHSDPSEYGGRVLHIAALSGLTKLAGHGAVNLKELSAGAKVSLLELCERTREGGSSTLAMQLVSDPAPSVRERAMKSAITFCEMNDDQLLAFALFRAMDHQVGENIFGTSGREVKFMVSQKFFSALQATKDYDVRYNRFLLVKGRSE